MWRDAIVVGTDGSPTADVAVAQAGALASQLGGEVHVVCSYHTRLAGGWVGSLGGVAVAELTAVEQARAHAEEIVAAVRTRLEALGLRVRTHLSFDEPAHALVAVADSERARMIVVGSQRMRGARRILGSVPARVSHHAHCAVLIVPTDRPDA
jgi:nucleotide-binding universal stress UspA family protein